MMVDKWKVDDSWDYQIEEHFVYINPHFGAIDKGIDNRLYYVPIKQLEVEGITVLPRCMPQEQEFSLGVWPHKLKYFIRAINGKYYKFLNSLSEGKCRILV
jgi:hypothetical protein